MIVGIDPGASTAIATFRNGKLEQLHTTDILGCISFIRVERPGIVVIEDSTLTSHVFTAASLSRPAALKIARNVGEIDAYCKIIKAVCADIPGIAIHSVSPKEKGAKLNAEQFKVVTGWPDRCNQHERDAAMVAWAYRNMRN